MNDELVFCPEEESSGGDSNSRWNILIIDDDVDIHVVTKLALENVHINGRGINISHAYSSIDGISHLKKIRDVDLVLLDMVMETHDAGLKVARWLLEEAVRDGKPIVILRTGHPGLQSTNDILMNPDFNEMIEKSNVTHNSLVSLLTRMLPGVTLIE